MILIWFYHVLKKPVSQRHREIIKQAAEIIVSSPYKHLSMWRDINKLGGDPLLTENCTAKINCPKTPICFFLERTHVLLDRKNPAKVPEDGVNRQSHLRVSSSFIVNP